MRKPIFLVCIVAVLALAVITVIAYKYWKAAHPTPDLELPVAACDLNNSTCTVPLPEAGEIVVDITPRPIPAVKPLAVSVKLSDTQAEKLEVDFQGVDMDMGYNRTPLTANGSRFTGQAMLPVCVTGRMKWAATFIITRNGKRLAVPFHFDVAAHGGS
ncbi:hypothetical protein [Propionivibrio soli]|uniref:hypothetical protein n=1 Tax=Propionivibrio soli TaxID=2976531 RepID=UPI0021E813FF|nr:hypothetical protein [Propionivibrio soli]